MVQNKVLNDKYYNICKNIKPIFKSSSEVNEA